MKYSIRISLILLWVFLVLDHLHAQQIKTYQGSASTPILENDIALAKNNAFRQAQQNVITEAIEELVEPQVFEQHSYQILRRQSLQPKNHLVSVKILNEYREGEEFSIELEARVQIDTLSDALKQMNLVFKNDPWFPVTLLIEDTLDFPVESLAEKLKHFHIKFDKIDKVNLIGISDIETKEKVFIEDLFLNYPQNRIIYFLLTTIADQDNTTANSLIQDEPYAIRQVSGLQLRILRKSDLEEINTISLKLPRAIPENSSTLKEKVGEAIPRLTSLLTINSVKRNTYESGLDSSYFIDISGLNAPYLRSAFEHRVLKTMKSINSYSLVQLSVDMCRYVIHSKSDLETLIKDLQQSNPYFELMIEGTEFNTIHIAAFYHYTATATEPELWSPDQKTLQNIRESVLDSRGVIDTPDSEDPLHIFYFPTLVEKEPNNSNIQFNSIPPSTYILGTINNRSDEDIFELKGVEISDSQLELKYFPENLNGNENNNRPDEQKQLKKPVTASAESIEPADDNRATIYLDWIQIGKTALAPQLRLYDEYFNFINAFKLVHSQKRLLFNYTFTQSIPEKIYIRISDKIGFIQGETGGFKQFQYMIRYSWTNERDMEPENPVLQ